MKWIGLKRYTVKLLPYQKIWEEYFQEMKNELLQLAGEHFVDIQHIGSTAIKGMKAKPIIDIAIAVQDIEIVSHLIPFFESIHFEYRGNFGKEGGHLFVKNIEPEVRTHHVHVISIHDEQWTNYLYFRDQLRSHPELAQEYVALKEQLADLYPEERAKYTASKNKFVLGLLKK